MKKSMILGMSLCVALAFTGCKSSESAYKKAYEKAKQKELAQPEKKAPVATETATPVVTAPVEQPQTVETSNVPVRQEKVEVVSGNGLLDFSVVCGSFGVKTNAENLKSYLDSEGYNSIIAFNAAAGTYRVIVSTHADRASAAQARDAFKAKYPNRQDFQSSWLLYRLK